MYQGVRPKSAVEVGATTISFLDLSHFFSFLFFRKKLSKIAFKRVLNARKAFRKFSARLPPEQREKWEAEFTEKGLFELREQTAQARHIPSYSSSLSDLFIVYVAYRLGACIVW